MKQNISALMDGELFDDEADALLDKIKRNPDVQTEWDLYHLVGDALRQPDHLQDGHHQRPHPGHGRLCPVQHHLPRRVRGDQRGGAGT